MKLFKYLFGSAGETDTTEKIAIAPTKIQSPTMDLFIDNEPPVIEQPTAFQPEIEQKKQKPQGVIESFLSRDYKTIGLFDGFEYHSQEALENAKRKIRTEFQFIMDRLIDEKTEKKFQTRTMLTNVINISPEAKQNLEILIEELNASIERLERQKSLSVEDEGWVMNAIHPYQQGFVQGLNDWVLGEQLISSVRSI